MAQLNARPTGDQEVEGSTPTGSATFFRGDLIIKCFLVFLSLPLFKKGSCRTVYFMNLQALGFVLKENF